MLLSVFLVVFEVVFDAWWVELLVDEEVSLLLLLLLLMDVVDDVGEFSGRKNGSGGRSGESDLQSSVVWDEVALSFELLEILGVFNWRHHVFILILVFSNWIFDSFVVVVVDELSVFTNKWGILNVSCFFRIHWFLSID